jgi:methylthioribulose 1-phosphate dehydratase/enolase-phosphatase E1
LLVYQESMTDKDYETKKLICELCRQFFEAGWVTGTGGSISIRDGPKIFMTPSGVQKERIQPDEVFTVDIEGNVVDTPQQKPGCREPKLSDCAPLFLHAYKQRNAGAVLHSHSACCNIITSLFEGQKEFTISHQEMIKGIDGYGYFDTLRIPIIENTAWEHELADSLGEAIANNPKACAVLVRRHGMYVWGNSWEQAKRHGECLHYLFDIAIRMKQLGMDFNSAPKPLPAAITEPKYKVVLLDIEGTTTPITFVKDTLFPYSAAYMDSFLDATWSDKATQSAVMELQKLAAADHTAGSASAEASGFATVGLDATNARSAASAFALQCIREDRKVGPLKQLQGRIWAKAYKEGSIKGTVYDDLLPRLEAWGKAGVRVAIYSSGSRQAQQLLFAHSSHGDLRRHLCAYFDTAVGQKQSAASYSEILLTLGAEPEEVLFVTDILGEAEAAKEAGMQAVISLRPGNAPIHAEHSFRTITTFADL